MSIEYKVFTYDDPICINYINAINDLGYKLGIQCNKYFDDDYDDGDDNERNTIQIFTADRDWRKKTYILAIDNNIDIPIGMISLYNNHNIQIYPLDYYDIYAKNSYSISQFYVEEKYRNMNIGSTLFKMAEDIIFSNKKNKIIQFTTQCLNPARRLYNRLGYKELYKVAILVNKNNEISKDNIKVNDYEIIYSINDKIEEFIDKSLLRKINYFNNEYNIYAIKGYIKNQMRDRKYFIFKYNNVYFMIDNSNSTIINILDIYSNNDKLEIASAINALLNYCIDNEIEQISYIDNIISDKFSLFQKFGFKNRIIYYSKIR